MHTKTCSKKGLVVHAFGSSPISSIDNLSIRIRVRISSLNQFSVLSYLTIYSSFLCTQFNSIHKPEISVKTRDMKFLQHANVNLQLKEHIYIILQMD
jgi:hypothetical protein